MYEHLKSLKDYTDHEFDFKTIKDLETLFNFKRILQIHFYINQHHNLELHNSYLSLLNCYHHHH